jgi:hypothetical protein
MLPHDTLNRTVRSGEELAAVVGKEAASAAQGAGPAGTTAARDTLRALRLYRRNGNLVGAARSPPGGCRTGSRPL